MLKQHRHSAQCLGSGVHARGCTMISTAPQPPLAES